MAADKKTLRLESVPQTACVRFAWNGGGELPPALTGIYTSPATAKQALVAHNAGLKEPVVLVEEGVPSTKFKG
jgi:hypothetical protein